MTEADRLISTWADARDILAEHFHADHYDVIRISHVPDGYGGTTAQVNTVTRNIVESGRCSLDLTGLQGNEAIRGGVPTATSTYTAELPIDSVIDEKDTLRINGREFEVISVARGGVYDLFTTVGLEERSI